jgi:hypothetical protein
MTITHARRPGARCSIFRYTGGMCYSGLLSVLIFEGDLELGKRRAGSVLVVRM